MSNDLEMRERSKFSKICSFLVDLFFVPVLIFAFVCSIILFSAKSRNRVPTLFGTAMVEVLSNSMAPDFEKGDLLTIKLVNKDTLEVGDAIAFYAPEQSGFMYGPEKPMVIYHQIIRIVYAENDQGVLIRYFVCKGINVTPETQYEFIEQSEDDSSRGDYRFDSATGKYVSKKEDGTMSSVYKNEYNYVAKLLNYDVKADENYGLEQIEAQEMSVYQYVTDEMVVGVYSGEISGIVAAFIKFCKSSTGILLMVILPSLLMIGLVVSGMIKESKDAKKNAEIDRKALNEAINLEEETKNINENADKKDKDKDEKSENKEKPVPQAEVVQPVTEVKTMDEIKEEQKKVEPVVVSPKKASKKNKEVDKVEEQSKVVQEAKQEEIKVPPKKQPKEKPGKDVREVVELKNAEEPKNDDIVTNVKKVPKKSAPNNVTDEPRPVINNEQQLDKQIKEEVSEPIAPPKAPKKSPSKVEETKEIVKNKELPKVAPKKVPTPTPVKQEEVKEPPKPALKKAPAKVEPEIKHEQKTVPPKVAPAKVTPVTPESVKEAPKVAPKKVPAKIEPVKEPPKKVPQVAKPVEEQNAVPPKKVPPKKS